MSSAREYEDLGCDLVKNYPVEALLKANRLHYIFIDREAREIMYLVASVRPSVCVSVCLSELSCLNRLEY